VTITLDSPVRDVLTACPSTGEIFIQHGRFSRHERGALYSAYDSSLTVGAFAVRARMGSARLLNLLRAADEDCDRTRQSARIAEKGLTTSRPRPSPPRTLGYTGGYREPTVDVEVRAVVAVQSARGPV